MSGLARKIKREKMRNKYRKFQRAWDDEKRYQQYLVMTDKAVMSERDGQKVITSDEGATPVLGKKPTFRMWMKAMENKREEPAQAASQEKKVDVDDLSWGEGG